MIYFTQEAKEKLDKLFYYPYTFGKHLDKANKDLRTIETSIPHLPLRLGTHNVSLRGIGSFTYVCNGRDIFLQFISWSTVLTKFYYRKSNFIIFTSKGNIPSTHPSLYIDRTESYFQCDNGFKVVSRKYGSKDVFNFKDLSGNIICDIDFLQVKPFDRFKDMTARGYTPDRRCYMVFEDGYKEEVNENIRNDYDNIIGETSVSKIANDETIYTTQFKGRFVDSELEKPNIYKENKQHNTMNNTKKKIRLTEGQLHQLIKKVIKKSLKEGYGANNLKYAYEDAAGVHPNVHERFADNARNHYVGRLKQYGISLDDPRLPGIFDDGYIGCHITRYPDEFTDFISGEDDKYRNEIDYLQQCLDKEDDLINKGLERGKQHWSNLDPLEIKAVKKAHGLPLYAKNKSVTNESIRRAIRKVLR